jgi:hypothetical protein
MTDQAVTSHRSNHEGELREPTALGEAANQSDDSATDGIQGDHADQQECEHHQGRASLPVTMSACHDHLDNGDQKRDGEKHSAGLGEPKPVPEPRPIAAESRHARIIGQRNEGHPAQRA